MPNYIEELLSLSGRHARSISLTRDLHDDHVVESYLFTPNGINALRQIGEGIASGRTQRAWKIVGPYGSGKSALGVMLAQLLAGATRHSRAASQLSTTSPEVAGLFSAANRLSLPIVGARMSFGLALATALDDAAQHLAKGNNAKTWRKSIEFEKQTYRGQPFNAASGEMVSDFADVVIAAGYQGLALLIDEVAKFVEYAALYPEQGDLIALQQVAEAACVSDDDKLIVIAMLHQHFASYAAGVGRALNDEWHKIAARFEEIPFDEPIERYAHFASHSLAVTPELSKNKELVAVCRKSFAQAIELGFLRAPSAADKNLFKQAERIYPLHPLTLVAFATISKRYGQSERSFHAFLKGSEPKGLREFVQRNEVGAWYRLINLYDFLSEGNGLRFRDLSAERRWDFARASVDRVGQDTRLSSVLKTIAVLELAQANLGAPLTAEVVSFALGDEDIVAVTGTLTMLVEQGTLVKRRKLGEYGMAVSDAINIEALYERAARSNESDLIVSGISKTLSQRPIVANRHYADTGTIRTMGILVGTLDAWPQEPIAKSGNAQTDAWLKLVLMAQSTEANQRFMLRVKDEQDQLAVTASLPLSTEGRAALAELAIWHIVQREVNSKRLDPWTSRYVEGRLQYASEAVERLVTSALTPSTGQPGPTYWHMGEVVPRSERLNPSQIASWLFETIYAQTPRVVNELINKDKPTPAIVLARQRMLDVILSGDVSRRICGDSEFPPERLIHTTLLKDTGIWHEVRGQWKLQAPSKGSPVDISAVWTEISVQLSANIPRTFAEVIDALAMPPLGVRAGPAGIWIVLYLLVNRSRCAVFERGTLILELTAEHLQRMYKSPQIFVLRELVDADASKNLLADYRVALATVGCAVNSNASYLELARTLFLWFARLPDFTKQTLRIGKDAALVRGILNKATDPIELLTHTLPVGHADTKSKLGFADWLASALVDLGMAHRQLQDTVAAELSKGFGISGPLSRVRNQLQAECTKEASKLADAKLKSFILRCTDLLLTDEKWLDSVGSLVVQRPLDSWVDDTIGKFQECLGDLCGRYKRWMQVVTYRGEAPRAADRFVGLTLTKPGGEEATMFVITDEPSAALANDVLALIKLSSNGNRGLGAAALAQALLNFQAESDSKSAEGFRHG